MQYDCTLQVVMSVQVRRVGFYSEPLDTHRQTDATATITANIPHHEDRVSSISQWAVQEFVNFFQKEKEVSFVQSLWEHYSRNTYFIMECLSALCLLFRSSRELSKGSLLAFFVRQGYHSLRKASFLQAMGAIERRLTKAREEARDAREWAILQVEALL